MLLKYLKIFIQKLIFNKISFTFLALGIYTFVNLLIIYKLNFLLNNKIIPIQEFFLKFFYLNPEKLNLGTIGISPYLNASFIVNLVHSIFLKSINKKECTKSNSDFLKIFKGTIFFLFSFLQAWILLKKLKISSLNNSLTFQISLIGLIFDSIFAAIISQFIDSYGIGKGTTLLFLMGNQNFSFKYFFFNRQINFTILIIFFLFALFFLYLNSLNKTIKVKTAKAFKDQLKIKPLLATSSYFIKLKFKPLNPQPLIITSNIFNLIKLNFFLDKKSLFICYYILLYCCVFYFNYVSFEFAQIIDDLEQKSIVVLDNCTVLIPGKETMIFLKKKIFEFSSFFSLLFVFIFIIRDYLLSLTTFSQNYFSLSFPFFLILSFIVESWQIFQTVYYKNKLNVLILSLNY